MRIAPFNMASALLVIIAGLLPGRRAPGATCCGSPRWLIQLGSPLIVQPGGRFEIRPAHFAERHGALLIVALGESVAAIGIGGRASWPGAPAR